MKIILNDDYYITNDPLNFILMKKKKNDASRKTTKNENRDVVIAYLTSAELAIARFLKEVQKKKASDFDGRIEEYYDAICKINQETVDELIGKIEDATNDAKGKRGK